MKRTLALALPAQSPPARMGRTPCFAYHTRGAGIIPDAGIPPMRAHPAPSPIAPIGRRPSSIGGRGRADG